MLRFVWTVVEDVQQMEGFKKTGFNRLLKTALKYTMAEMHNRYAKRKFTRRAYSLYRGTEAYRYEKWHGDPFVKSGTMRSRLRSRTTPSDVRGTSKRVTLTKRFGRPPRYTEKYINNEIRRQMRAKNLTFAQARRLVYSKAGYDRWTKAMIQEAMAAVNGGEANSMRVYLKRFLVARLQTGGRKRKRRLPG